MPAAEQVLTRVIAKACDSCSSVVAGYSGSEFRTCAIGLGSNLTAEVVARVEWDDVTGWSDSGWRESLLSRVSHTELLEESVKIFLKSRKLMPPWLLF